jgi:hypothetical protein
MKFGSASISVRFAVVCFGLLIGIALFSANQQPSSPALGERVTQALDQNDWGYKHISSKSALHRYGDDDNDLLSRSFRENDREVSNRSPQAPSYRDKDILRSRREDFDDDDRSYRSYRDDGFDRDDYSDDFPRRHRAYRSAAYDDFDSRFSAPRYDPQYEFKRQDYRSARLTSPEIVEWEMDMERGLDRLDDDAETMREREEANLQLQEHWLGLIHARRWDGLGERGLFFLVVILIILLLTLLMCVCLLCLRRFCRKPGNPIAVL